MTIEIGNKGMGLPSGNYVPGSGGSGESGGNPLDAAMMEDRDFNNYTTPGTYYWTGWITPANHPSGNEAGYLLVITKSTSDNPLVSNATAQIFTLAELLGTTTPQQMWMRYCTSNEVSRGTWSAWTKVNGGEVPANMVTTDTYQTITGVKVFEGDAPIELQNSRYSFVPARIFINSSSGDILLLGDCFDSGGSTTHLPVVLYTAREHQGVYRGINDSGNLITYPLLDTGNFATLAPTGNLKYWTGTEADYTALETKDADTLYRTTDTNKVFLGEISLSGSDTSVNLQFSPLEDNGYSTVEDITIE